MDADAIVVGAGLAGLVAARELTAAGRRVALLDQENHANLGGQAYWSFGGLFLVDTPEQRRLGVHDSVELAWSDWLGSAQFDRLDDEDAWAARWARAAFRASTDRKPARNGSSTGRFLASPKAASATAQGPMMALPQIASRLQSQIRLCASSANGSSAPIPSARSTRRRNVAR